MVLLFVFVGWGVGYIMLYFSCVLVVIGFVCFYVVDIWELLVICLFGR